MTAAMYSSRARRRRTTKLRRQRSNAPRAVAAALFFFLLCYEMLVLRPPAAVKPSLSAHSVASPPPVAAPSSLAASPPAASVSSPSSPSATTLGAGDKTPQTTTVNSNIVAKAAVSPPSIASRLASLQKLTSSITPPSTSQSASQSLRVAADQEGTQPSPSFHPLHKRHGHGSHSAVAPSLAKMESVAADNDDSSPKPQPSSSAHKPQASKPEHGADPGAGENFWKWFQDTKESEGSANVTCPPDSERVCLMFYKFLKKYKIRSVYDISCARNLDWMPPIVRKVGNELWGFKYYCNTNTEDLSRAKEKLAGLSYVEFAPEQWWRTGFTEGIQLLFAWDVLPHIAYGRIWNFFVKSKAQNIKYLLFDNYPGIMNDPSPKRQYLNIRKHPFRFPAAKEVVQNVTEPGETEKRQLLFYETDMLPDNLQ